MGISCVISGMATLQIIDARPTFQADGGMRVIASQVTAARELAIAERRFMRLQFTAPNIVEVLREDVPGTATTVVREAELESGVQFALLASLPDTPDAFGKTSAVFFGTATAVKFSPDRTLVNQDGVGVFLAIPTAPRSARAITVLGATGRIRLYRWDGKQWNLT